MPRPRRPTRRRPTSKLRTIPYCQCRALRTIVSQYHHGMYVGRIERRMTTVTLSGWAEAPRNIEILYNPWGFLERDINYWLSWNIRSQKLLLRFAHASLKLWTRYAIRLLQEIIKSLQLFTIRRWL